MDTRRPINNHVRQGVLRIAISVFVGLFIRCSSLVPVGGCALWALSSLNFSNTVRTTFSARYVV